MLKGVGYDVWGVGQEGGMFHSFCNHAQRQHAGGNRGQINRKVREEEAQ